jgi:hypothetical protein
MDFHHLSPAGFSGAHLPFAGRRTCDPRSIGIYGILREDRFPGKVPLCDGMPVRSWVLPGNTADVTTVARIKDDLRAWRLGRCLFVGDAGMTTAALYPMPPGVCAIWSTVLVTGTWPIGT